MIHRNSLRARAAIDAACGLCGLVAGVLLGAAGAVAGETAPVSVPGAEVRLVSGSVGQAGADAGIEIRLAPNWKTYWRYPGDSGVPPALTWSGSQNIAAVEMAWPAPRRFSDGGGGFSIGYKGAVLLPLRVGFLDRGKPARLDIGLDFAVCEALCMPAHATLSLDLVPGDDAAVAARIAAARAKVPEETPVGDERAPAILDARLDTSATPPRIVIEARVATSMADLFLEGPDDRWALPLPQKTALPDGRARFVVPLEGMPPGARLAGTPLQATLVDMPRAVSTRLDIPE